MLAFVERWVQQIKFREGVKKNAEEEARGVPCFRGYSHFESVIDLSLNHTLISFSLQGGGR